MPEKNQEVAGATSLLFTNRAWTKPDLLFPELTVIKRTCTPFNWNWVSVPDSVNSGYSIIFFNLFYNF